MFWDTGSTQAIIAYEYRTLSLRTESAGFDRLWFTLGASKRVVLLQHRSRCDITAVRDEIGKILNRFEDEASRRLIWRLSSTSKELFPILLNLLYSGLGLPDLPVDAKQKSGSRYEDFSYHNDLLHGEVVDRLKCFCERAHGNGHSCPFSGASPIDDFPRYQKRVFPIHNSRCSDSSVGDSALPLTIYAPADPELSVRAHALPAELLDLVQARFMEPSHSYQLLDVRSLSPPHNLTCLGRGAYKTMRGELISKTNWVVPRGDFGNGNQSVEKSMLPHIRDDIRSIKISFNSEDVCCDSCVAQLQSTLSFCASKDADPQAVYEQVEQLVWNRLVKGDYYCAWTLLEERAARDEQRLLDLLEAIYAIETIVRSAQDDLVLARRHRWGWMVSLPKLERVEIEVMNLKGIFGETIEEYGLWNMFYQGRTRCGGLDLRDKVREVLVAKGGKFVACIDRKA